MPKQRAQIKHIMAERQGHLKDSSKIVKGNEIWVHTRNGTIQNGGSNGRNYKYHKMGGKK